MPPDFVIAFEFFHALPTGKAGYVLTDENSCRFYQHADSIQEKMEDFPEEAYAFRFVALEFKESATIGMAYPLSGMVFLDAEPLGEKFVRTRDGLTAPFDPKNDRILTRNADGVWNEKKSIPHPR